jgi:hypothetical protein
MKLLLASVLLACTQPARPAAPVVSNQRAPSPAPPDACNRDLSWLAEARYLRYSQFSHGHFGEWRFHVDFYRLGDADTFEGIASGSFRHHARSPIQSASKPVTFPRADATKLLTTLRDGVQVPPDDASTVVVTDSSRSVVVSIEAMAFDPRIGRHPNDYVQFFVDDGETEPQAWNIRGCSYRPPHATRKLLQNTTEALAARLGNDAMLQQLEAQAPRP